MLATAATASGTQFHPIETATIDSMIAESRISAKTKLLELSRTLDDDLSSNVVFETSTKAVEIGFKLAVSDPRNSIPVQVATLVGGLFLMLTLAAGILMSIFLLVTDVGNFGAGESLLMIGWSTLSIVLGRFAWKSIFLETFEFFKLRRTTGIGDAGALASYIGQASTVASFGKKAVYIASSANGTAWARAIHYSAISHHADHTSKAGMRSITIFSKAGSFAAEIFDPIALGVTSEDNDFVRLLKENCSACEA